MQTVLLLEALCQFFTYGMAPFESTTICFNDAVRYHQVGNNLFKASQTLDVVWSRIGSSLYN